MNISPFTPIKDHFTSYDSIQDGEVRLDNGEIHSVAGVGTVKVRTFDATVI